MSNDVTETEPTGTFDEDALFREFSGLPPRAEQPEGDTGESDADTQAEDGGETVAAAEVPAEEGVTPEAAPASAEPEDPFASLTPAARQALAALEEQRARLEHADASNRNRVSAMQKKLNEYEAKIQELEKKTAPPEPPPADEAGVDLKQFAEDFPEVYAAMRALHGRELTQLQSRFDQELNQLRGQVETVKKPIVEMEAQREQARRDAELSALAQKHPDYVVIQKDDRFWKWIESQPQGVKALVSSNAAADNIVLLDLYKQQTQKPTATTSQPPRRPRSAEGGETLPRTGVSRIEAQPNDEDAAWDYWSKRTDFKRK